MKTHPPKKSWVVFCYRTLIVAGVAGLAYCAVTIAEAAAFQRWAYREMLHDKNGSLSARAEVHESPSSSGKGRLNYGWPKSSEFSIVGRLEIPSIHASMMVAEGDSSRVLRRAVGHVPGTALPGQRGNVVLAGHRDTFFRRLGSLGKNDLIELETAGGTYRYRVESVRVVGPDDTWVLAPCAGQTLTLVTCYPFHFIGPAPDRFIIRANIYDKLAARGS